jgi:hypothetical protein
MFSKYSHVISLILIVVANCEQIEIKAKNQQDLIKYNEDSFIVDIKKIDNKNDFKLVCTCSSCSELNFSFQNHLNNASSQVNNLKIYFLH